MFTRFTQSFGLFWQAGLAILLLTGMDTLLSDSVSVWSRVDPTEPTVSGSDWSTWVLTGFALLLILGLGIAGQARWVLRVIGFYALMMTLAVIVSASALVLMLSGYQQGTGAFDLLWDAMLIWVLNAVLFGLWYWLIDGGGPLVRHTPEASRSDFVFPLQATPQPGWAEWQPTFFDYLFLAFTVNTAYSPTDTLVLSRRAKFLLMLQSLVALLTFAMVVARAINIIQ